MPLSPPVSRCAIQAVLFDWAGTLIDFGSLAPVHAFADAFAVFGIDVSEAQIRKPMGTAKRAHIASMLAEPAVRASWVARHGAEPGAGDIDNLYAAFLDADERLAAGYCSLVPGARATIESLLNRDIRVGATTGYPRRIVDRLLPIIAAQGVTFAIVVSSGDVARGRPAPDMNMFAADHLCIADPASCVAVDDTLAGIEAGAAAGMWTVGVAASGNELGLSLARWSALTDAERAPALAQVRQRMNRAGAHIVIDSVAGFGRALDWIETRCAAGERP